MTPAAMPVGEPTSPYGSEACTAPRSHVMGPVVPCWSSPSPSSSTQTSTQPSLSACPLEPHELPTASVLSRVIECENSIGEDEKAQGVHKGRRYLQGEKVKKDSGKNERAESELAIHIFCQNHVVPCPAAEPGGGGGSFDSIGNPRGSSIQNKAEENSKNKTETESGMTARNMPVSVEKSNISSGTINNLANILKKVTTMSKKRSKSTDDQAFVLDTRHRKLQEFHSLPARGESPPVSRDIWTAILDEGSHKHDVDVEEPPASQTLHPFQSQQDSTDNEPAIKRSTQYRQINEGTSGGLLQENHCDTDSQMVNDEKGGQLFCQTCPLDRNVYDVHGAGLDRSTDPMPKLTRQRCKIRRPSSSSNLWSGYKGDDGTKGNQAKVSMFLVCTREHSVCSQ